MAFTPPSRSVAVPMPAPAAPECRAKASLGASSRKPKPMGARLSKNTVPENSKSRSHHSKEHDDHGEPETSTQSIVKSILSLSLPLITAQYTFIVLPLQALFFASLYSGRFYSEKQLESGSLSVLLVGVNVGSALYFLFGFVFIAGLSNGADVMVSASNAAIAEKMEAKIERLVQEFGSTPVRRHKEAFHNALASSLGESSPSQPLHAFSATASPATSLPGRRVQSKLTNAPGNVPFGSSLGNAPPALVEGVVKDALEETETKTRRTTYHIIISSVTLCYLAAFVTATIWLLVGPRLVSGVFLPRLQPAVYAALCYYPLLMGIHAGLPSLTKFFQYQHAIGEASATKSAMTRETYDAGHAGYGATDAVGTMDHSSAVPNNSVWQVQRTFSPRKHPIACSAAISMMTSPLYFTAFLFLASQGHYIIDPVDVVQFFSGYRPDSGEGQAMLRIVGTLICAQAAAGLTELGCLLYFLATNNSATSTSRESSPVTSNSSPEPAVQEGSSLLGFFRGAHQPKQHRGQLKSAWSTWTVKTHLIPFAKIAGWTLVSFLVEAWLVETYLLLAPLMHCDPELAGGFTVAMQMSNLFFPCIVGLANAGATLLATVPPSRRRQAHLWRLATVLAKIWLALVSAVIVSVLLLGPYFVEWMLGPSAGVHGAKRGGSRATSYAMSCLHLVALFYVADTAHYMFQCIFRGLRWIRSLVVINAFTQWLLGIPSSIVFLSAACPNPANERGYAILDWAAGWLPEFYKAPLIGSALFTDNVHRHQIEMNDSNFNGGPDVAVLGYIWPLLLLELPLFSIILFYRLVWAPRKRRQRQREQRLNKLLAQHREQGGEDGDLDEDGDRWIQPDSTASQSEEEIPIPTAAVRGVHSRRLGTVSFGGGAWSPATSLIQAQSFVDLPASNSANNSLSASVSRTPIELESAPESERRRMPPRSRSGRRVLVSDPLDDASSECSTVET